MPVDEELLKPSRELIASLDVAIKKSEAEAADKIKRFASDDKAYANQIWRDHMLAIEPLRRERDHVVKVIADYYGLQAMPNVVLGPGQAPP